MYFYTCFPEHTNSGYVSPIPTVTEDRGPTVSPTKNIFLSDKYNTQFLIKTVKTPDIFENKLSL